MRAYFALLRLAVRLDELLHRHRRERRAAHP
jgi:hypothetical protein